MLLNIFKRKKIVCHTERERENTHVAIIVLFSETMGGRTPSYGSSH